MVDQLLRINGVRGATTLSRTEIYRRVKAGTFPAPVSLGGGRAVAWRVSDISAFIASLQPKGAASEGEANA